MDAASTDRHRVEVRRGLADRQAVGLQARQRSGGVFGALAAGQAGALRDLGGRRRLGFGRSQEMRADVSAAGRLEAMGPSACCLQAIHEHEQQR